jgi:type II secretory ATPase GspE/PulE/Tfp pilus assembly ATPase PilB-like protein
MSLTVQHYQTFWSVFSEDLASGLTLANSLERASEALEGSSLALALNGLKRQVISGSSLSEAMNEMNEMFTPAMAGMVRAGEAGGVLEIIAARVRTGLQYGCLTIPDGQHQPSPALARLWRCLGLLLSSGLPVLDALKIVAGEIGDDDLQPLLSELSAAIEDGRGIAEVLAKRNDLFSAEICNCVKKTEQELSLDESCLYLAEAVDGVDFQLDHGRPRTDEGRLRQATDSQDSDQGDLNVGDTAEEWVNTLLKDAIARRASDIHLDPAESGPARIRMRIDGGLRKVDSPPEGMFERITARLKILSKMDLAERRLPQYGRATVEREDQTFDLHMSTLPTSWGERVVIRILHRQALIFDIERMGFLDRDLEIVRSLCHLPNGLILCTGPTGSGKTTVLYSMLHEMDRETSCVISIEDPVEVFLPGVAQIPVKPWIGLTFPRAIDSAMRQDPDVLHVAEIRDFETLQATVSAALTGHLAFSTLHTDSAVSAVQRLLDIGLEPFLVNATLKAVIGQRLIRVLCNKCKKEIEPEKELLPSAVADFVESRSDPIFHGPNGCDECKGSGYRGRTTAYEILIPDTGLKQLISERANEEELQKHAHESGMRSMLELGLEKAARGITSLEEVVRVLG